MSYSYRKELNKIIQDQRKKRRTLTLSRIALLTEINLSYLSNTLKERAHLSADQIYSLGQVLEITPEQTQMLSMMMEWERCNNKNRQKFLEDQIQILKRDEQKTHKKLETVQLSPLSIAQQTQYFLDSNVILVHLLCGIEQYAVNPKKICEILNISIAKLDEIFKLLGSLNLLKFHNKRIESVGDVHHLSEDSSLCDAHQKLFKLRALEKLSGLSSEEKKSIQVSFTADPETYEKLKTKIGEFLSECEKLIIPAPQKELYQLSIDLFPWS